MDFFELFLLALGLSADAFAAALCRGMGTKGPRYGDAFLTGLLFGGFQAAMPLIGWFAVRRFSTGLRSAGHFASFVLLCFIGGKMMLDSTGDDAGEDGRPGFAGLLLLAFATSIDAMAAGVTFAFLPVRVLPAVLLIGTVTAALSTVGALTGARFAKKHRAKAGFIGGLLLVLLALHIFAEGIGML